MKIQKTIDVHMIRKRLPRPIDLVQYDTGIQLVFVMVDFTPPEGASATLYVRKPSGKFVYQETGLSVSDGKVTIDLENQAITEHGEVPYQVRLANGDDLITTFAGIMRVEKSLADADAVESKTVISSFNTLTAEKIAEIEAETDEFIAQAQAKVADKGVEVLATIPEDYTATYNMANSATRTKADAIICSAEGDAIMVSDSSDDPLRGLKLFGKTTQRTTTGKNLLDVPDAINTTKGVSFAVDSDGIVTATGTPTEVFAVSLLGTYSEPISFPAGTYIMSGGVDSNHYLRVRIHNADGTLKTYKVDEGKGKEFTVESGELISVSIYFANLNAVSEMVFKPMIRLASVADDTFEPYTGGKESPNADYPQGLENVGNGGTIGVNACGKNLWNHENDNADMSSLRGWGTAMWSNPAVLKTLMPNTTYTLKFKVTCLEVPNFATVFSDQCGFVLYSGEDSGAYINMAMDTGHGVFAVGEERTVVGTFKTPANVGDKDMHYEILRYTQRYYQEDKTAVYATVRLDEVQLEIGNTASGYEPYTGQTMAIPTDGGIPGIPVSSGGNYTDADSQKWIADVKDYERGVYVQRIQKMTLTGDEAFVEDLEYNGLVFNGTAAVALPNLYEAGKILCSHAPLVLGIGGEYILLRLSDFGATSVSEFKAVLAEKYSNGTPVEILYALPEPVETALTATEIEAFKAIQSNYPNTTVLNDAGAWMEVKYNADTKTFINNVIREAAVKTTAITLYADKWVDEDSCYSQVVSVNGVTANSKIDLQPSPDQLSAFVNDEMSLVTGNDNGTITVYAIGNKPVEDVTIQALITEVYAV